jgi:hypothetical protein
MWLIRYWLEHRYLLGLGVSGRDQVQANALEALILEMEHLGGAVGEVDNPARDNRSPVIDPDVNHSSIVEVGDAYPAAERQSRMSRCQFVHLIGLAAGGSPAFKGFSVPRCCS